MGFSSDRSFQIVDEALKLCEYGINNFKEEVNRCRFDEVLTVRRAYQFTLHVFGHNSSSSIVEVRDTLEGRQALTDTNFLKTVLASLLGRTIDVVFDTQTAIAWFRASAQDDLLPIQRRFFMEEKPIEELLDPEEVLINDFERLVY